MTTGSKRPEYFHDHVTLREMPSAAGHAVRMGYLAAGATDVAIETGDQTLMEALGRLWDDMVAAKLYITGGLGSRHADEAIGDRYELPSITLNTHPQHDGEQASDLPTLSLRCA